MKRRRDNPYGPYVAPRTTRPSLIRGLRDWDRDKWELFVRLYGPWVFRRALSKTGNPEDAADVAQWVVLGVLNGLGNFRRDDQGAAFRRWLNTITQRQIANHFRTPENQKGAAVVRILRLEEIDPGRLVEDPAGNPLEGVEGNPRELLADGAMAGRAEATGSHEADLDEGLEDGPPRDALVRAAFHLLQRRFERKTVDAARLRLVEGLPAAVVAERLGMSCAAVHVAVSRVRKALRELLNDPLPGTFDDTAE